ncbi:TPA: prepilin peptidase, partial [Streptococcus pneumoniae]|nr:prepilin peptidase [Streptococcus pneumoniae]
RSVIFQIQFTIKLTFLLQKKKERLPFVPFLLLAVCLIIFGKLLLV